MADATTADTTNVDSSAAAGSQSAATGTTTTPTQTTAQTPAQQTTQQTAGHQTGTSDAERRAEQGRLADLQKERRARQQFEQQYQAERFQRETLQRQIQALTGASPKTQDALDAEEVKANLAKYLPGLAKLDDATIERLLAVAESKDTFEQTANHYWTQHGTRMIEAVESGIAKEFGSESLTPKQQKAIRAAYRYEAESNPEFLTRHEQGDKTLIAEFVKDYTESFFEPARRKVTQSTVNQQRNVPQGGQRSVIGAGGQKVDLTNDKAFGDAAVEAFKNRGGSFGG